MKVLLHSGESPNMPRNSLVLFLSRKTVYSGAVVGTSVSCTGHWANWLGRAARSPALSAAAGAKEAAREPGQAYVAVSRVRSLAGLHFKEWFKGVHVSPEAIRFYEEGL